MRQDKSHKKIEYKFYYPFRWGELSQRIITENKFLLELGYDDYYNHLGQVITKEGMQLQQTKLEQVKTAIIAIIVDSFAHNIGAHSLVALKWWFEVRYSAAAQQLPLHAKLETQINTKEIHKKIKDRMKDTIDFHSKMDDFDHKVHTDTIALLNIVRFMDKDMEDGLLKYIGRKEEPEEDLIAKFPVPVAQSIYHFFQYLRDKSAFWSGVTRDTLFSGRIRRWDRIFRTFLNNTLFLGTIAHSEGINKIRFHVEILTPESKPEKNKPKILIGGEYAEINLEIIKKESGQYVDNGLPEKNNNDYSDYAFLRKGADFDEIDSYLREELEAVYLPNGIIGQHALYTLIENTLRNIKHYKWLLPQLRQEGVTLCISIQEVPFLKRMDDNLELFQKDYTSITKYNWTSEKPLYKIGAWLHHPQKLLNPVGAFVNEEYTTEGTDTKSYAKFHKKGSVIGSHTQQLRRRVVNEKGNPVLGGSSQDKVCASMLLNNNFQFIDAVDLNDVKRQYFPYVIAASEMYQPIENRRKEFTVEDDILHKAYNPELACKTASERVKQYKKFVISYIEKIVKRKESLQEAGLDKSHAWKAQGTIKKYFHVWKGEKAMLVDNNFNYKHENLSRFRVLAIQNYEQNGSRVPFREKGTLKDKKKSAEYDFRVMGLIRLVEAEKDWQGILDKSKVDSTQVFFELAMKKWLSEWFETSKNRKGVILFREADLLVKPVWGLYFDGESFETVPYDSLEEHDVYQELGITTDEGAIGISFDSLLGANSTHIQPLIIQHSASSESKNSIACRIRSHTSFFSYIFDGYQRGEDGKEYNHESFIDASKPVTLDSPIKLIETVLTHITFFDSRIYERFHALGGHANMMEPNNFWKQLRIQAYPEDPRLFRKKRNPKEDNEILSKHHHFIVIHLSFLEAIFRSELYKDGAEDGEKVQYKESEVLEFFQNEFEAFVEGEFPPNIILVITSGRGRGDWFHGTEHPQITFRPIESLLSSIEDGLSLKDDFQIKYNLCNVLFGS